MNNYKEIGEFLRKIREEKSIDLTEVANFLKIRKKYLDDIENGDHSEMPGRAYMKGYIKLYSEYLGVFEEVERIGNVVQPKRKKFVSTNRHINQNWVIVTIFSILILILIIIIWKRESTGNNSPVMNYLIEEN